LDFFELEDADENFSKSLLYICVAPSAASILLEAPELIAAEAVSEAEAEVEVEAAEEAVELATSPKCRSRTFRINA
jgi:hypothetical protein